MHGFRINKLGRLLAITAISVTGLVSCGGGSSGGGGGGGATFGAGSLAWAAPTTREDGTTPITSGEIASYRVLYGDASCDDLYDEFIIDATSGAAVTLEGIAVGSYCAVVTAIDSDGRESLFSDEIAVIIQ